MFNDNTRLTLDLKAQDRLREWFSKRADGEVVKLTAVQLGDSDIHYEMSQQISDVKILNAPFQVDGIKHKLIYSGSNTNLTGTVECYVRYVNEFGQVASYYNYPTNLNLSLGVAPPTTANQVNTDTLTFGVGNKEGYICFFQTLPDNFVDTNNVRLRLKEEYDIVTNNVPNTWEVIVDQANGSLFIAKPTGYTFAASTATITVKGQLSSISKTITFNI